jgi:hypothetical protein
MTPEPDKAMATFVANLESKTGKTVAEWIKVAREGGAKHAAMVKYLKSAHGLSHGYANYVALQALDSGAKPASVDAAVDEQYTGAKTALRPVYDKLMKAVQRFGDDIEVAPKKGYVSLRRKKQFAMIGPGTRGRLEVGLNLKGVPGTERLQPQPPGGMCQYKVFLTEAKEADQELVAWLRQAYDAA